MTQGQKIGAGVIGLTLLGIWWYSRKKNGTIVQDQPQTPIKSVEEEPTTIDEVVEIDEVVDRPSPVADRPPPRTPAPTSPPTKAESFYKIPTYIIDKYRANQTLIKISCGRMPGPTDQYQHARDWSSCVFKWQNPDSESVNFDGKTSNNGFDNWLLS